MSDKEASCYRDAALDFVASKEFDKFTVEDVVDDFMTIFEQEFEN